MPITREEYERALAEHRRGESELAVGQNFFAAAPQGPPEPPPVASDARALPAQPAQPAPVNQDQLIKLLGKAQADNQGNFRPFAPMPNRGAMPQDVQMASAGLNNMPPSMPQAAKPPPSPQPAPVDAKGAVFAPAPQDAAPSTWGGGGGGGYVAPHMGVTSRSTQKGVEFSPETLAAQRGMAAHAEKAAALNAEAEMQQQKQAAELAAAQDSYAHGERAMQHINEGRRGIEQFHAEQEVRDKKSELAETPATVQEYFAKQSTAGKVVNMIGLMLGGVDLMGNRGGRNSFLDGIQNTIAGQMGKKGHELDFAVKGVKDLEGKHDKARMLEAQKYRDGLEAVKMEMGAQARQSGDPGVLARYEQAVAAIDKESTTIGAHLDEAKQNKVVEHESLTGGSGGGGSGGIGAGISDTKNVFHDPSTGASYVARDPDSKKILSASLAATANISSQATEYQNLLKTLSATDRASGKVGVPTEKMARATDLYNGILGEVRQQNNDGVWKKSETELLTSTLQKPDQLFGNQSGAQAGQLAHMANTLTQNLMKTHAPLPVREGWGRDKAGRTAPTAEYTGGEYQPPVTAVRPPMKGR